MPEFNVDISKHFNFNVTIEAASRSELAEIIGEWMNDPDNLDILSKLVVNTYSFDYEWKIN